jgi:hypothetical protein
MTIEEIEEMKKIDIRSLDRAQLVDMGDIQIDETKSISTRVRSFLEQVGNPFTQRLGEYVLVIGYNEDTEETIDDRMLHLAKKGTQIIV